MGNRSWVKVEKSAGIYHFSSRILPPQITRMKWIEMECTSLGFRKTQCIRDIGAIRGSNKHSQGGRGGTRRRIAVNKAQIHKDIAMI